MKNKLKKLLSLGCTLFAIGLLLTNCERDNPREDAIQIENQEPTFTLKQYSKKNIEKNTKLVSKLKEFNDELIENKSAKTSGKNTYNKEFDFTIYTGLATYIENGDYHSYTFPIVQGADEKITNVLFDLNDENEYDAYLVKYDYSANEFKFQDFNSLSMKTKMKPIDLDFNSLFEKTKAAYVCFYNYDVRCCDNYVSGLGCGELTGANYYNYGCSYTLTTSFCETVYYNVEDSTNYGEGIATVTIGGTSYSGSGGSQTSPTPSPFNAEELMKIDVVKSELNLNHPERLWIDEYVNGQIAFQIYDFGVTHMWAEEAKAFALEAVKAMSTSNFTSLLSLPIFNQDPYNIWKNLSQAEKNLIKQLPLEAYGVFENRKIAEDETRARFGSNGRNDKSDAFRHAYYTLINSKVVGISTAELFSDAHESEVPNALLKEKQMDLFNNNVGHQSISGNGDKSLSELSNIIFTKLVNGNLRYLSPLNFVSSPLYDANRDGVQDCPNCANGITSATVLTPTNQ